jgi:DNA-binding transcriptional LysR family regulator
VTPAQLRAYAAVVRHGSVKDASVELGVTDAAISLHVAALRKELGDQLFVRTSTGLAFTPGGLRLASRAGEILGLADRTVLEVGQAGRGRRLLRVAATALFAEHAAPGLIELFARRADDLDVELSVPRSAQFATLLRTRAVDVAIGPQPPELDPALGCVPFLKYQVVAVVGPDHPLAGGTPSPEQLREQTWLLGPAAAGEVGAVPATLRRLRVPELRQRIFQSDAAALEQVQRGQGLGLSVSFAIAADVAAGRLARVPGVTATEGTWTALSLAEGAGHSPAAELVRFVSTPRATQAMLRGAGVAVGRFRPSVHVTLWS